MEKEGNMAETKKQRLSKEKDKNQAISEIGGLQGRLDEAYCSFNRTTDKDTMDACIYEINALRSRYNTAIKHYRERYY